MFVFGLRISDVDGIARALTPARRLLVAGREVANANGWGLGYYDNGEVLLHRRPRDESDLVDFFPIACDLKTHAMIGHRRTRLSGRVHKESTHPFRHRNWLFAHSGELPGFGDYQSRLEQELPAFLGRLHPEAPDSNRVFHLFLSKLAELTPHLDAPGLLVSAPVSALRSAVLHLDSLAQSVGAEDAGPMAIVCSNGRHMVGFSRRIPMALMSMDVPAEPPKDTALRARLLVTTSQLPQNDDDVTWETTADEQIVAVARSFEVSFHALATPES